MDTSSVASNSDNTKKIDEPDSAVVESLHDTFSKMFTKENLEIDPYLRPHLSQSMSLPLEVVVKSPMVQTLSTDSSVIERALRTSNSVVVGETSVRPNIKVEQHTIILRDVDSDVTESAIRDMIKAANCGEIVGCRSEMNSTWFVTFKSEDVAREALINIRSSTLGGKPVRGRLKTESITKSFYQPRGRGDPNMAPTVGDGSGSPNNRPAPVTIDPYAGQGQHSGGPSLSGQMGGPVPPNGMPPGAPMYYMYPPYPGMPMPVPGPGGSPMYYMAPHGGMWPPMMPMMQMPQHSPMNGSHGGRGGGRGQGRGHKSSPRNGGGKQHHPPPPSPTGPHNQQRPRGNSHGNKAHVQHMQGQSSPYGYGHGFPMPPPDGREQHMGGPVAISYDAMGNPVMHMTGGPVQSPRVHSGDTPGEITKKESQDGGDDKGDKNRKKTPKANKKKEKPAGQEGVAAASTSTAAGVEPVVASGANEKRAKGSDAAVSKGASTRGSEGNKEKGAGKERTDKSPRARGAGAAAGGKSSQKPQPEFNMESDFPTLGIRGAGGTQAAAAAAGTTSWAAAIMKAPNETVPAPTTEGSNDDKTAVHVEPAPTQSQSDHNGAAENADVDVSFGYATAWMSGQIEAPASVPMSLDTNPAGHVEASASATSANGVAVSESADYAISFGAFDQPSALPEVSAPQDSKPKSSKESNDERPVATPGSPSKTGDKQKRAKGNNSRSGAGNKKTEVVDAATEESGAVTSGESGGKAWGGSKMSFLDVVRGGGK